MVQYLENYGAVDVSTKNSHIMVIFCQLTFNNYFGKIGKTSICHFLQTHKLLELSV